MSLSEAYFQGPAMVDTESPGLLLYILYIPTCTCTFHNSLRKLSSRRVCNVTVLVFSSVSNYSSCLNLGVALFRRWGERLNEGVLTVGIVWVLWANATSDLSGYKSLPTASFPVAQW